MTTLRNDLNRALDQIDGVVRGKKRAVRLALSAFLAQGHLLIEDVPGVGKTTLALALARTLGLSFQRIQFTADLLPADILGASVYDPRASSWTFHPGPIFHHVILADEINRATPKTQSALLEAMGESQVTIEGKTHPLPRPFFVIATQNPLDLMGTFPLPDSQLDRFALRIDLGYPSLKEELQILQEGNPMDRARTLPPLLDEQRALQLQEEVRAVRMDESLMEYLLRIAHITREDSRLRTGLSTRAVLMWAAVARAWAYIRGRDYVIPEDLQDVAQPVIQHRLVTEGSRETIPYIVQEILQKVPVPI
jgi:MoxR-like ATPase